MADSLKHAKVLLVEGKDEVNFFGALLKHCGLENVDIREVGGKDKFPNELSAFLLSFDHQVQAYAIIRDADSGAAAAFQSVTDLLKNNKEPIPTAPEQYANSDKRRVGVFIMPGNQEEGMLEDLCLQTVAEHPVMSCVEGYLQCLQYSLTDKPSDQPKQSGQAYFPKNRSKAKAQAFMAGMHETVNSVGVAAQKGCWNLNHASLNDLKSFIQAL
jgi:hypothetical protein